LRNHCEIAALLSQRYCFEEQTFLNRDGGS
jgi:hypothetical protein